MADRNSLHRNKLEEFKSWLIAQGHNPIEGNAAFEVLRWKVKGKPMPIIFGGKSSEHFSCNDASMQFVCDFINSSKEPKGKPSLFIEKVYELAFGDSAIVRGYSEKEVLDKLREFSDKALEFDKLV